MLSFFFAMQSIWGSIIRLRIKENTHECIDAVKVKSKYFTLYFLT